MISADMREYDYLRYGDKDDCGQLVLNETVAGKVKMAINLTSQVIQDNINYKDCQYMGLTHSTIDDTYVILYGNERLKVLYVNPRGRLNQVFMATI